jgi:hypothetical protein
MTADLVTIIAEVLREHRFLLSGKTACSCGWNKPRYHDDHQAEMIVARLGIEQLGLPVIWETEPPSSHAPWPASVQLYRVRALESVDE